MKKIEYFNMKKLPDYFNKFSNKKAAIIGAGAVGSYVLELLVKMNVVDVTVIDFDYYASENSAKSSCLYDPKKDDGKSKAIALAKRTNEYYDINTVHGINASITCFGPMAFFDYDVVFLALDNYASKMYFNQLWLQIPKEKRPLVIMGGTKIENEQVFCLDGNDSCIRCQFDERWLNNTTERTSCTGTNYKPSLNAQHEVTTGLASARCAIDMVECFRAYVLGHKDCVNSLSEYIAYPHYSLNTYHPTKRRSCPDCKNYHSIENAEGLADLDVFNTTVDKLCSVLKGKFPEERFKILAPIIEFNKIAYGKIIKDDYCRCCGKQLKEFYRHEFKTKYSDLLCEDCKKNKKIADPKLKNSLVGTTIGSISSENIDPSLKEKTLFELGYPIGCFIQVLSSKSGDFFDDDTVFHTFYLKEDISFMKIAEQLEEDTIW